jgi:4-diphosphocytidyl-2-C-methyl-D-erythritol kinase
MPEREARAMRVPAPAKLNLFLHVTGRRTDGYHELESLMVLLEMGDSLLVRERKDGVLRRCNEVAGVSAGEDLCLRAARVLQSETGCPRGADIVLEKTIPLGSGMGGGSSDAASTLLALNRLWSLDLERDHLIRLAARIGADVPFFVFGESALARGIGERLRAVTLPPAPVVVIVPPVAVPTAVIFSDHELVRDSPAVDDEVFPSGFGRNDLQPVACRRYPEVEAARAALAEAVSATLTPAAAARARMSGSGAASFALLEGARREEAETVLSELRRRAPGGSRCFGTRVLPRHPLYELASAM